jgi:hypothetical protein
MPLPKLDYDSLVTTLSFLRTSIPSESSDGTKLGLEDSTSKMTSGNVAARASA